MNNKTFENCKQAFSDTYEGIIASYTNTLENSKYSIAFDEIQSSNEFIGFANTYVLTKVPTFFNSKLGDIKNIELFAINIIIKLAIKDSKIIVEIISHFNPDSHTEVKPGESITCGTNKHLQKVFDVSDSSAPEIIKDNLLEWYTNTLYFYIPNN